LGTLAVDVVAVEYYYQHVIGTVQDTFKTNKTFAQKYQNFCRLFRFVFSLANTTNTLPKSNRIELNFFLILEKAGKSAKIAYINEKV